MGLSLSERRIGCRVRVFQKRYFEGPRFLTVAEEMLSLCDTKEFALFVGIARRIWLRRNEVIHGGPFLHPNVIIQKTLRVMEDRQAITDNHKKEHSISAINIAAAWKAPPLDFLKAN